MSFKKAFRSYLYIIFKCALVIWLRSLTVEISDVPCTNEVVSLLPGKLETVRPFLECIVAKSFENVNLSGKNFKFEILIKFYT